jgi:hypothetical protein
MLDLELLKNLVGAKAEKKHLTICFLMAKSKTKMNRGSKICAAGISWAKRTFDKYPSAYANMAASKYCKDPNYAKNSKKK